MDNTIDERAAYCGLFCGACPDYLATRSAGGPRIIDGKSIACDGCRSGRLPAWCAECELKACAARKGLAFCGECAEYPCAPYAGFRDAGEYPYHLDCPAHLKSIASKGAAEWVRSMEQKYSCPRCSKPVSWWSGTCPSCGAPTPGYRKPVRGSA